MLSVRLSSGFVFIIPDRSVNKHLPLALPTGLIFYLLGKIRSERLVRLYSEGPMLDMLEIIIKWLQVSVSEHIRQTLPTKNPICF